MLLSQLFEAETLNEFFGERSARRLLQSRGWEATTVPREYQNPDAPGYSIDLDMHHVGGEGPFTLFRGTQKLGQLAYPPYASHLMLKHAA